MSFAVRPPYQLIITVKPFVYLFYNNTVLDNQLITVDNTIIINKQL